MRNLAHRLISAEFRPGDPADSETGAALRVCDKLRESLSVLSGTRGYRTLLLRALSLAKADFAWLMKFEVDPVGVLLFPEELARELDGRAAARGCSALVAQLLELLATFVGDALTQRLVLQIWPHAAIENPNSGGKK
jgi:hypothetical protein